MNYSWGGVFPVAGFIRDFNKGISINKSQKDTPIIIGHGVSDEVVPIESSEKIYKVLKDNKYKVHFEKYNGGHKISIDYLKKISKLINT